MHKVVIICLFSALGVSSAAAQTAADPTTNPNATCADYMKFVAQVGPTPKTGDAATDKMAADMDQKMADY